MQKEHFIRNFLLLFLFYMLGIIFLYARDFYKGRKWRRTGWSYFSEANRLVVLKACFIFWNTDPSVETGQSHSVVLKCVVEGSLG